MVNYIARWCEIKFPEREFREYDGISDQRFSMIEPISDILSVKQLMYRLNEKQLRILECEYRASGGYSIPIYDQNEKLTGFDDYTDVLIVNNKSKEKSIQTFNVRDGHLLVNYEFENDVSELETTIKNLYDELKNNDNYDCTKLKECLYDHEIDILLREFILRTISLKLLFSRNTIPEHGYIRAKKFILEFNREFNLNLKLEEINNIINYSYANNSIEETVKNSKNKVLKVGLLKMMFQKN